MDGISYTRADAADAEKILSLCKENMDEYEDTAALDFEKVVDWIRNKINKYISEYTRIYKDGKLCGYYRFHLDEEEDKYELDDIYLFDGYRGQGIGSAVLKKCLESADKTSYLFVFKKNTGAVKLYKKFGFEVTKELKTRYIMEKKYEVH